MDYSLQLIGSGSFGKVYMGHDKEGNKVVIKVIPVQQKHISRIKREVRIPQLLAGHKNIAAVITAKQYGDKVYIISEYVAGAINLEKWPIPETQDGFITILDIMYELADAYDYMHQRRVVHRDVKPHNILMKGNVPILIDWDLACLNIDNSPFPCRGVAGTPNYLAPELWEGNHGVNPFLTDIYSLGVVFYYLANQKRLPYTGTNREALKQAVLEGNPDPSTSGNSTLDDLIMSMMARDPNQRISLVGVKTILQTMIKAI